MTRLITLLTVLSLAAGAGAQINHPYNEIGIYTVEQPDGCETAQVDVPALTPFTCYLVLTNPYNEALGRPVANVGGFECRVETAPDVYLLGVDWSPCSPPWWDGPEFIVGCTHPVQDGQTRLLGFSFMSLTGNPSFFYLTPLQDAPQSIPGQMAFTDYDDLYSLQVMYPVSGSADVPVFAINWDGEMSFCETVPDETVSFGGVKALYR